VQIDNPSRRPFYEKLSFNLVSLCIICLALIYGQVVILPLLFGILLANLLLPATRYLENHRFSKPAAVAIPLVTTTVIASTLLFLISSQVVNFLDDLPALQERINMFSVSSQKWIKESTHITIQKQNQYWSRGMENFQDNLPALLSTTVSSVASLINYVFLIPLYTFLVLHYRSSIKAFLIKVFRNGSEDKVREVLSESTNMAQHYVRGLLMETLIVFILNLIGFLIIGVKYKVLLALLAAMLNLIPYLGMLIASVICMLTTLLTSDHPGDVVWVGIALAIVQIIDNNIGMPLIVGNKVRINAMVTIVGVILGGVLCGIPGMFMAIPGLAVLKIIFDKVPELRPWGALFGDGNEGEGKKSSTKKAASL
jgi:predicted PurR-regulated permease PerM